MKNRFGQSLFCLVCATLALGGCSTRAWYESVQLGAESQCDRQPPGAREDCLARLNRKSFDAYGKERGAPN